MKDTNILDTVSLDDRLKGYEKNVEIKIPYDNYLVVRIDGHKFSKFTSGFDKPFDKRLSKAFENTTMDLISHFGAVTGYTQSDEITLIFIPNYKVKEKIKNGESGVKITNNQIFAGRTQKIASLLSAFTTMTFNKHLKKELLSSFVDSDNHWNDSFRPSSEENEYRTKRAELLNKAENAWFDARVFGVPDDNEAFNTIMWRVRDATRNSKNMFANSYCAHKKLVGKNSDEQIKYCKEKSGNDWHDIDDVFKYGILVKKENYTIASGLDDSTIRTRVVSFTKDDLSSFSKKNVDLVTRKYL